MRVFTHGRTGVVFVEIPTRAPVKMQKYAKVLAYATGKTLKVMLNEAAERFLQEKPWEHGLKWRPTKSPQKIGTEGERSTPTGWMQINIRLPESVGVQLETLAVSEGVSISSVGYTLLYWWTWWIYPPASERKRRESLSQTA